MIMGMMCTGGQRLYVCGRRLLFCSRSIERRGKTSSMTIERPKRNRERVPPLVVLVSRPLNERRDRAGRGSWYAMPRAYDEPPSPRPAHLASERVRAEKVTGSSGQQCGNVPGQQLNLFQAHPSDAHMFGKRGGHVTVRKWRVGGRAWRSGSIGVSLDVV